MRLFNIAINELLEAKGKVACLSLSPVQLCKALSKAASLNDRITIFPLLANKGNYFSVVILIHATK
jgi:hypothetical protein